MAMRRIETATDSQFDLMRRFLLLSLIAICIASVVSAALMSRFLTDRLLRRDAELTGDFVQNAMHAELAKGHSLDRPEAVERLAGFLRNVAAMPDVARANLYGTDSTLLWSSENRLQGRRFANNPELAEALEGHLAIESGEVQDRPTKKAEHDYLGTSRMRFVELYIPLRSAGGSSVIGVVELYRLPVALTRAIDAGAALTWMISIGIGLFLYAVLFWIVRRADRLIRFQQQRLIESETMSALGEMASAVAHGIRNPLASIRSSAELWQEAPQAAGAEAANDIISEVHRIECWIRELLTYSTPPDYRKEATAPGPVIARSLESFARELKRRKVSVELSLPPGLPQVQANAALLAQALNNLISNALEAMPAGGGTIAIACSSKPGARQVGIEVRDTGSGIAPENLGRVCQPFYTTKANGLGVGLTLVRRIARRFGGDLHIDSVPGGGTAVTLVFPVA
jgi:signal transduction histidine kinase